MQPKHDGLDCIQQSHLKSFGRTPSTRNLLDKRVLHKLNGNRLKGDLLRPQGSKYVGLNRFRKRLEPNHAPPQLTERRFLAVPELDPANGRARIRAISALRRTSTELQQAFMKSGLQSKDDQREEKQRARGNVSRAKIVEGSELR